jgi:hypothetical protein
VENRISDHKKPCEEVRKWSNMKCTFQVPTKGRRLENVLDSTDTSVYSTERISSPLELREYVPQGGERDTKQAG